MRPLKLVMSAFGPYADRVELNMDRLGENGLYLITGRTGSGKTMIFDAISFALYGEPSGNSRQPQMLRSKYAAPETPTFVELTFLYKGKTYTVRRNPEYERPAKRGDGMTRQLAGAELTMPDQSVISRQKDVNEKIGEILGVDRDRFSQIAMIAQGDFIKLLTADTLTRQTIFRKIFHTDQYEILQNELKKEAQTIGRSYETARNRFSDNASMLSCAADSVCLEKVQLLRGGALPDDEVLQLAQDLQEEDQEQLARLTEAEEKRNDRLARLNALVGRAEQIEKAQAALAQYEQELETAKKEEEASRGILQQMQEKEPEKVALTEQITLQKSLLERYGLLDQKRKEAEKERQRLISCNKELETCKTACSRLEASLEAAEKEKETLADAPDQHAAAQNRLRQIEDRLQQLEQVIPLPDQWRRQNEKALGAAAEYEEEKRHFQAARDLYDHLHDSYMDAQAGILAGQLKEGKPCPVCGSLTHPHPAVPAEGAADEASVKKAKKAYEQAQKKLQEKSRIAGTLQGEVSEKKARLTEQLASFAGDAPAEGEDFAMWLAGAEKALQGVWTGLTEEKDHCIICIEKERKRRLRKEELEKEVIPETRKSLEQKRNQVVSLQEEITGLVRLTEEKEHQLRQLQAELAFPDKAQAQEHIQKLEKQISSIDLQMKTAQEQTDLAKAKIERLKGSIAGQKEFIKDAGKVDRAGAEQEAKALNMQALSDKNLRNEITGRMQQNKTAGDRLAEMICQMKQLQERRQIVGALSMTASGAVPGKEKIMLETYVQMQYFDRIIERANSRFMVMSGGQFELRRQKSASNFKAQSGLELSIKDHHSGTERNVRTLSGGESFMAALSMALGLSDEIQAQSGGIQLDTMFVDEGFGTLDDESLELAMRALLRVAGGHRLIGIISHVDTLKTRIEKQVQTSKDADGKSSIRIVLP